MYGSITLTVTVKTPEGEWQDIVLSQPTFDEEDHMDKYEIMVASVGAGFPQAIQEVNKKKKAKKGR